MLKAAAREPATVGLKTSVTVQLAPAVSVDPQVFDVSVKSCGSAPVSVMEVMPTEIVPVFVMVTVWGGLVVPTATLPKLMLAGATRITVP
jgi:hypothetical protein